MNMTNTFRPLVSSVVCQIVSRTTGCHSNSVSQQVSQLAFCFVTYEMMEKQCVILLVVTEPFRICIKFKARHAHIQSLMQVAQALTLCSCQQATCLSLVVCEIWLFVMLHAGFCWRLAKQVTRGTNDFCCLLSRFFVTSASI